MKTIHRTKGPRHARQAASAATIPPAPAGLNAALAVGIALAALIAYANSFAGVFVFDDMGHIVSADNIRRLLPIQSWLMGNPRPVVTLSLAVNYRLGELNPFGYHVLNLVVHVLAGLTLCAIIRRTMLRLGRFAPNVASWSAFAIALIWVVHPLQTQSVTFVIQRSESMMGLFFLVCVYCVLRGVESRAAVVWYIAAVAAFTLSMGCKAAIASGPFVIFFFDGLFLSRSWSEPLRRRWALYAGLMLAVVGVLKWTGLYSSLLSSDPGYVVTVGVALKEHTPLEQLATEPGVILHYLRLAFWPHPLCIDYEWRLAKSLPEIILPAVPLVLLIALTVWALYRRHALAILGVWFFGLLAPSSSIVPVRDIAVEHRMYLPLAAVVTLAVLGLVRLTRPWTSGRPVAVVAASCLVAVVFGWRTFERNKVYVSPIALWWDVITTRRDNARAWTNYGEALANVNQINGALEAFQKAMRLDPNVPDVYYNMGNTLQMLGRLQEAEQAYLKSIALDPNNLPPHIMLGNVYVTQERYVEAEKELRAAIASANVETDRLTLAKAHYNLGNTLMHLVRIDAAIESYRASINVVPEYDKGHYGLAFALERKDRFDEAQHHYIQAVRFNPKNAEAREALEKLPQRMEERQVILKQMTEARMYQPAPSTIIPSHRP